MSTIYFSNGETAEVENVQGHDPRTFTIPAASYAAFANAMTKGATMKFSKNGETYLLTQMRGDQGRAVLQVVRARR